MSPRKWLQALVFEDLVWIIAIMSFLSLVVLRGIVQNMWISCLGASAALFQRFTASLLSNIVKIKLDVGFGNVERNLISNVSWLPRHSQ